MNNEPIPVVEHFKYLGHILSDNKGDDLDIERQRKEMYAQGNSILRKFHMCSIEVKVELFKTLFTPLYTANLWTKYSSTALKIIYIAYHNVMKLFIGLSRRDHNRPQCLQYNILHGPALICNFIYKFICRLFKSQNKILYILARSDCLYESQIRKKWRSLLYGQSIMCLIGIIRIKF